MDADRFDTLARSLTAPGTRRRTLAAVVGSLGLLGLTDRQDATAARSGKCKPKCGECEKCKKGNCEKKNGKKKCKKGKCKAKANGTACAGGTCQGGTCVPPPFCAGKNVCTNFTAAECDADSIRDCHCYVTDSGASFCGDSTQIRAVTSCGLCNPGETCLNLTGCMGVSPDEVGCAPPCPNPL